jgi:ATP-binding cassette, subfamily C, bacterial CydD
MSGSMQPMKQLRQLYLQDPTAKRHLLGLGLFSGVLGMCSLTQWWTAARLLEQIIFLRQSPQIHFVGLGVVVVLVRGVLLGSREHFAQAYALERARQWRNQLATDALHQRHNPDQTQTKLENLGKLEAYCARFMPSAVQMVVVPLMILLFALWLDLTTGLVFLLTAPLIPLLMWLIGVGAKQHIEAMYQRMQHLGQHFMDIVRGLEDLQSLNRSRVQRQGIEQASLEFAQTTLQALRVAFFNGFVMELTATIATALVAVLAGTRLLEGQMSFSVAMLCILLCPEFYNPIRQFGLEHHTGMEAAPLAKVFMETQVVDGETKSCTPNSQNTYSLQNVVYGYPGATAPALTVENWQLEQGLYAIVGRSGSGKTTLLNVLLGLLKPHSGAVCCGEQANWSRAGVVGYLAQQPHFWNATLLENLRLVAPNATSQDVFGALEAAKVLDFVSSLPEGINTPIGERGLRLSAGERQRLALARIFLQPAPLVVLDEATSSLDWYTQDLVQQAIAALAQHRTVVMVAHRLETVQYAKEILVLEQGKVVERGTHKTLLAFGGEYARLWCLNQQRSQASEVKT